MFAIPDIVAQPTSITFTLETYSLEAVYAFYRATGDNRQPAPAQTVGVGQPDRCNIQFVFGRGYVEVGGR